MITKSIGLGQFDLVSLRVLQGPFSENEVMDR